ncbi:MAG: hypothetical protein LBJ23_04700, partial [Tannerella sp.]|nr:hypothetical protein [Tannerella sp.]
MILILLTSCIYLIFPLINRQELLINNLIETEKKNRQIESVKSEKANAEKLLLSLKDTVYARAVEPEDGAAHLQELLRLYPDRTGWE